MVYELALAALADPTRRAVLQRLRPGPRSVGEIAAGLPVSRPAVSQHLRVLEAAHLVRSRRQGTRRIYTLDSKGFAGLGAWLARFRAHGGEAVEPAAEAEPFAGGDVAAGQADAPEALEKSLRTRLRVPEAFRLFTQGMASWWPLATHSLSGKDAAGCGIEGRPGGRVFERSKLGRVLAWGSVLAWEPPHRLVFTWHPGREPDTAQEIEVRFSDAGDGETLVEMQHRGWARLGAEAASARDDYDGGWDHVLRTCYARAAQSDR